MSRWNTVAIYGVGLIGGSIGMALRTRGLADRIIGIGRSHERLAKARELGAISVGYTQLTEAPKFDLAVVCTPVQTIAAHCHQLYRHAPNALLTDAGSTKRRVVQAVEDGLPAARFVGSHPLAGSDRAGVEHASDDLFVGHTVVITPTTKTDPRVQEQIVGFWRDLGGEIVQMPPQDHDVALATTSHLPHVVASALAAETPHPYLRLVAGGWRDTTRIAAADVALWTQILQENNDNVAVALAGLRTRLETFETAILENDQATITRLLTAGKQHRDAMGS